MAETVVPNGICGTCQDRIWYSRSIDRWFHRNGDDLDYDHRANGPVPFGGRDG